MNKSSALGVAVLILLASQGSAQEPQKTSLAVYQIKAAGQADKSLGSAMTSLLSSKLTQSPKLKVIEEGMLKTVMERQAMNESDACDDTSCQVEIGKLVKAQKLITGDLVKLGSKYILSLKLIDIQSGANEFSTEDQCACSEDQLDVLVEVAAAKVRNHFGEAVPIPVLPQAGAAAANSQALAPASGTGSTGPATVYVYRKSTGYTCSAGTIGVVLDNQSLGAIKVSECVKKEVPAGNHVLQGLKQMMVKPEDLPFQAVAGGKVYIQGCCCGSGAKWKYSLVSEAEAAAWAGTCQEASALPVNAEPTKRKK